MLNLGEVSSQIRAPHALPPGKNLQYLLDMTLRQEVVTKNHNTVLVGNRTHSLSLYQLSSPGQQTTIIVVLQGSEQSKVMASDWKHSFLRQDFHKSVM